MINTVYSLLLLLLAVGAFACLPAQAADPRADIPENATISTTPPEAAQPSEDSTPSADTDRPAPRSADNGAVQYTSGGVGSDSLEAIRAEEKSYNLKLLFAERAAYLASVKVTIADSQGRQILDTTTEGPILLVKMPAGTYKVSATRASGDTLTQRVKVGKSQLSSYVIRFSGIDQ